MATSAGKIARRTSTPRKRTAPRRAAVRRTGQREALLEEAARQFNTRGVAAISVNDVAKRVGLTRAAVYYYVEDSEDLVFQCYMRACQLMADDLAAARETETDEFRQLASFIRRMLLPERPVSAVVSEVAYLSEARRALVSSELSRNVAAIEDLLRDGARSGALRACDAHAVAQAIVGILSWAVLSPGWVAEDGGAATRIADALIDQLEYGLGRDRKAAFQCRIDVRSLFSAPGNMFDRDFAAAMKVEQVLETASRLFNESGLDGVSLEQIASALGATKGVLYHYFADKRELILRCYERSASLDERFADIAEQTGRTGVERGMIGLHLNVQAQVGGPSPLVPLVGFESLPAAPRKALQRRLEGLHKRFTRFGAEGIEDGSARRCDVDAIALAGAGMFGWIPKWLPASSEERKWALADEMVAVSMRGLRPL
jgi:AcrR family transcriptional regulator